MPGGAWHPVGSAQMSSPESPALAPITDALSDEVPSFVCASLTGKILPGGLVSWLLKTYFAKFRKEDTHLVDHCY
jgi:hypothetical protein